MRARPVLPEDDRQFSGNRWKFVKINIHRDCSNANRISSVAARDMLNRRSSCAFGQPALIERWGAKNPLTRQ
jgi:hypothetical protein